MAFGKNINNVIINGLSTVQAQPNAGVLTDVGYVAEVSAETKDISYEATLGKIVCGHDWTVKWNMLQTKSGDWNATLTSRQLTSLVLTGANDTMTFPSVFLVSNLKKTFNNKADSMIMCEVILPGVSLATSQTYFT